MRDDKGTPKTLDEAIQNAMDEAGLLHDEIIIAGFHAHIQDYLAQKFSTAMYANLESQTIIGKLFIKCVNKKEAA